METKYIERIGLPWYTPENYERMKKLYTDSSDMPQRYDDWLKRAERIYNDVVSQSAVAVKVYIDPDVFVPCCVERNVGIDKNARKLFVQELLLLNTLRATETDIKLPL